MIRIVRAWMVPLASFLTVLVIPVPALGQDQGDPPVGKRYALLVGVSRYDARRLRNLPFTEPDVTALAEVLRAHGYHPQDVVMLTEGVGAENPRYRPTLANIRKELVALLQRCRTQDMVLVVLTGHGRQLRGDDEPFFLPCDAALGDATSCLSIIELYEELASCAASYKLLLVDACRDDTLAPGELKAAGGRGTGRRRPPGSPTPGCGVAALLSCSPGQVSYDHDDLRHAIFFHFAIEGLKGAAADRTGRVTLPSLRDYLGRHVPTYVRERYPFATQVPQGWGCWPATVPLVRPLQLPSHGDDRHLVKPRNDAPPMIVPQDD